MLTCISGFQTRNSVRLLSTSLAFRAQIHESGPPAIDDLFIRPFIDSPEEDYVEEKIALFLYRFKKLKYAIKDRPSTLSWVAGESDEIQEMCYQLDCTHCSIKRLLLAKHTKHTAIPSSSFESDLSEYERYYLEHVRNAAAPAAERAEAEFKLGLERAEAQWVNQGKTSEEFWNLIRSLFPASFDPLEDDPAWAMQFATVESPYASLDSDPDNDDMRKIIGGCEFFETVIGLDYGAIWKRWKNSPELYITSMMQLYNITPLVEMYDEAAMAYVLGNKLAAVTMCRALMEHILKKYYNIQAGDLKGVIAIAEQRFPQLKKFGMQKKRRLANDILHDFESENEVTDKAVVDFLKTIKSLVHDVCSMNERQKY